MLRSIALAGLLGIGLATVGLAGTARAQALSTPAFIKAAAATDEFERIEGRLATRMAVNPRVRGFGAEMVTAHTKTTIDLKAAIAKAGLPAPGAPMLTADQRRGIATLKGLQGPAFDKAYVGQQIVAHQTALGVMQAYAAGGDNPVIRRAAAGTVPIVQHHLAMAQALPR